MADLEAAVAGDPVAALDVLLTAWRTTRSAVLGEVIEVVGARVDSARPRETPGKQVSDRLARWAELASGGPAVIGELMRTLLDVPGHALEPRFEMLVARDPDPRIALGVLAAFEQTFRGQGATWHHYRLGHAVIVRHGDARALTRLAARAGEAAFKNAPLSRKNFWAKTARELRTVLPEATDDATERRVLDLVRAAAPKPIAPRDAAALLLAIYEDPADDGVRQVYADFLLEHDDPRGELINLQLARARGAGTPAGKRRENELLRTYSDDWLGAIAPAIQKGGREFERGFLHTARVGNKGSDRKLQQATIGAAEWATVVDVDIESFDRALELVTSPVMKALRTVRGVYPQWLSQQHVEVERLVFRDAGGWFARYGCRAMIEAAPRSTWKIQHLECPAVAGDVPEILDGFWSTGFARGLASMLVHVDQRSGTALNLANALRRLATAGVPKVHLLRTPTRTSDWAYTIVHDGAARRLHVELRGERPTDAIVQDLGVAVGGVVQVVTAIAIANLPDDLRSTVERALASVTSAPLTFDA